MDDSGAESIGTQDHPISVDLRLLRKEVAPIVKHDEFSDAEDHIHAEINGEDKESVGRKRRRSESPSTGDVSPGSSSGADAGERLPRKRWNLHPKKMHESAEEVGDSPDSTVSRRSAKPEEAITIKCEPWSPDDGANSSVSSDGSHDGEKEGRVESKTGPSRSRILPGASSNLSSRNASPRSRSPKDVVGPATSPNGALSALDCQRFPAGVVPLLGLPSLNRGFVCEPCGIRFSSPGTLQAHQTYYCAARKGVESGEGLQEEKKAPGRNRTSDSPTMDANFLEAYRKPNVTSPPHFPRPSSSSEVATTVPPLPQTSSSPEPSTASSKLLKCPHCPFSTEKKLILAKHLKAHSQPETELETSTQAWNGSDRYCHDCGIQFSSLSTYRVHRKHYCQGRRNLAPGAVGDGSEAAPAVLPPLLGIPPLAGLVPPAVTEDRIPCVILPTNPLLVIPYPILQCARFVPLGAIPPESIVVGADGTLTTRSHQMAASSSSPVAASVSPRGQTRKSRNQSPDFVNSRLSPGKQSPKARQVQSQRVNLQTNGHEEEEVVRNDRGRRHDDDLRVRSSAKSSSPRSESPLDLSKQEISHHATSKSTFKEERGGPEDLSAPRNSSSKNPSGLPIEEPVRQGRNSAGISQTSPAARSVKSEEGKRTSRSPGTEGSSQSAAGDLSTLPHLSQLHPGIPPNLMLPVNGPFPGVHDLVSAEFLSSAAAVFGQVPGPGVQQPYVVKKGVSKCSECNIVFYKRENYLIHKKHYCASRQHSDPEDQQPAHISREVASAVQDTKKAPGINQPPLDSSISLTSPMVCKACGTKFSSSSTLLAHQAFYCSKIHKRGQGNEGASSTGVQQCPGCLMVLPSEVNPQDHLQVCKAAMSGSSSHVWQCPCCEFITTSIPVAQCHLERHAGLQAFRCLLCGYKGNTLRGMRIHIRMQHFDPKQTDIPEESIISYIVAGEVELPSGGLLAAFAAEGFPGANKIKAKAESTVESSEETDLPDGASTGQDELERFGPEENGDAGTASDSANNVEEDRQPSSPHGSSGGTLSNESSHPPSSGGGEKVTKKFCKLCKTPFFNLPSFIKHKKLHCPLRNENATGSSLVK